METRNVSITPSGGPLQKIHVSQNDVGRTIKLNISDGNDWYDLTGCTVKLEGTKPSSLGYSVTGTVSGHTVTIVTTKQMTDEFGSIASELKITKSGLAIGTANVILEVEKDPHPEHTTDGSVDELIPEITLLVERAEAAAQAIQDMDATASTGAAGTSASVEKVIDPDTGAVTLAFTIPKGDKGDTGDAFHIVKTYASVAAMNADYSGTDTHVGDYVMITSTVEDPDNAKVYIKGSQAFEFVVDMSGATGIKGEDGYSPTATVTKSGDTATISITDKNGTTTATVSDGEDGEDGTDGVSPAVTIAQVTGGHTVTITDADHPSGQTFTVLDGEVTEESLASVLEDYARIDGFYEDMGAGYADQLASDTYESDSVPYLYRTTGGSTEVGDRSYNDSIVGASVAWNQLVQTSAWTVLQNTNTRHDLYDACLKNHVYLALAIQGTSITSVTRNTIYYYEPSTDRYTFENATENYSLQKGSRAWMVKAANDGKIVLWTNGASADVSYNNAMIIDLTALFGSSEIADYIYSLEQANAGAGVAWLRNHGFIDGTYKAYDSGSLKSVEGLVSHDTVGFNQWDEEWELGGIDYQTGQNVVATDRIRPKNYIPVIPSTAYYAYNESLTSSVAVGARFYDADRNYIGNNPKGAIGLNWNTDFTTPDNAYFMRFVLDPSYGTTYNHDICINLSWDGSRDGEYEPYRKHSYPLDDSLTLRGIYKLDASNKLYADGDIYPPSGEVGRRYGIVDLGTLNWSTATDGEFRYFSASSPSDSPALNPYGVDVICSKYSTFKGTFKGFKGTDKEIWMNSQGFSASNKYIVVSDSAYSDATAFKTAMSGVYLVYELATPTTESADPYQQVQIVDDFGTEEFVIDSGSFPVPVGHQTRYMANLKAKLEMAPNSPSGDGDYIVRQVNGTNSYVPLVIEEALPTIPTTDGDYRLKVTVADGESTLSWEAEA